MTMKPLTDEEVLAQLTEWERDFWDTPSVAMSHPLLRTIATERARAEKAEAACEAAIKEAVVSDEAFSNAESLLKKAEADRDDWRKQAGVEAHCLGIESARADEATAACAAMRKALLTCRSRVKDVLNAIESSGTNVERFRQPVVRNDLTMIDAALATTVGADLLALLKRLEDDRRKLRVALLWIRNEFDESNPDHQDDERVTIALAETDEGGGA